MGIENARKDGAPTGVNNSGASRNLEFPRIAYSYDAISQSHDNSIDDRLLPRTVNHHSVCYYQRAIRHT
jgi:hypothetical protein